MGVRGVGELNDNDERLRQFVIGHTQWSARRGKLKTMQHCTTEVYEPLKARTKKEECLEEEREMVEIQKMDTVRQRKYIQNGVGGPRGIRLKE